MVDETSAGGAAIDGNVSSGGGNVTGRDDRRDPRQRSDQNITFTSQDNLTLYLTLQDMRADIRQNNAYISDVNVRLDDLPNRVSKLEIVLKPEVAVKVAPDASNISNRTMFIAMMIGFGVVASMVLFLYWWT